MASIAPDQGIIVWSGAERLVAQRAYSCLIEPQAGDVVLLASAGETPYVLAVLSRLLPDAAALSVPGARALGIAAQRLELQGGEVLALQSAKDVEIRGAALRIRTDLFALVGRAVSLIADRLRTTARRSETVAEQIAIQAGERTSLVRGPDISEAGLLVQKVEGVASTTATTAVLVAKEDVRFDGKRVTVG
ncbi:DUF3540 domain-containing protein [Xanthobacteraceae bacterium A53D]